MKRCSKKWWKKEETKDVGGLWKKGASAEQANKQVTRERANVALGRVTTFLHCAGVSES